MRKFAGNLDIKPHICKCKGGSEEPNRFYLLCAVCEYVLFWKGERILFPHEHSPRSGQHSVQGGRESCAVTLSCLLCWEQSDKSKLERCSFEWGSFFKLGWPFLSSSLHMEISTGKRITLSDIKKKGGIFKFMKALDLGWVQNRKNLHIYRSRCPKSVSYTQRLCF